MAAPHDPPPRAARLTAAERSRQLAHVAARRFHELGYHGVSLADVAAEAGVTGPAVYRHFRNKESLLAAAIASGLDLVEGALMQADACPLPLVVDAVAQAGLRRPDMWVLLQRESRLLGPELQSTVAEQFSRIVDVFARRLRRERPELTAEDARLLVAAATSVLSIPSTTRTSLPEQRYRTELVAGALTCLRADLSRTAGTPARTRPPRTAAPAVVPAGRREQLVETAVALFARRSFSGVSLDDIGADVGITGPSVLHHFSTKADILVTAFDRATGHLATLHQGGPTAGLGGLISGYVDYALTHRELLSVYVSESLHLPEQAFDELRASVRTELAAWAGILLAADPTLEDAVARVRVRAALAVINDLVRRSYVTSRPRRVAEIELLAMAALRGHG